MPASVRAFAGDLDEGLPYPSQSRASLIVDADRWDDSDWLTQLISISAAELPMPEARARRPAK